MQLSIVLVFVLKMFGVQSQYWTQPGWGQPFRRVPIYCKCVPYYTCSEEVEAYRNNCQGFNEVCCQKLANTSPQHRQQHPSQVFPNSPTKNPSSHQRPQGLSHIFRQTPNRNPLPHRRPPIPSQISPQTPNRPQPPHHRQHGPSQTSPNTPNRNQSFQPRPQVPSHRFLLNLLRNPSFQHWLHGHGTSQITHNPQTRNPSFQQWLQGTPNGFPRNPTSGTLHQTNLQDLPQTGSHASIKNPSQHHRLESPLQISHKIKPQRPSQISSQTPIQNQPPKIQPLRPSQISIPQLTRNPSPQHHSQNSSQTSSQIPTKSPSLDLQPTIPSLISTQIPNRNPSLQPQSPSSSQISSKIPTRNQPQQHKPPSVSQISTSNANCICTPFFRCYDEETSSNLTGLVDDRILIPFITSRQIICPGPNEICCQNLVPPSLMQTRKPSQHPNPQGSSSISPQIAIPNQSGQHQSLQIAVQISSTKQSQLPPSQDGNCNCIPFRECYDEEISSNLAALWDDQSNSILTQRSCPGPNNVCCHNLVQPLTTQISSISPQPQPTFSSPIPIHTTIRNPTPKPPTQGQSLTSPQIPIRNPSVQPQPPVPVELSPNTNCICTPFFKCFDEETSSNLTTLVDDRSFIPSKQGNCPDPNDVCCYNLVQPLTNTFSSLSPQPQPTFSSTIPIHTTIRNPTPKPPIQGQSLTSPQTHIRNPSAQPQPQVPAEISPNTNCICTPFFKCYDEETSSNLTTLVDDRSFIPSKQKKGNCPDPNDVCCYNLFQPLTNPFSSLSPQPQPTFSSPIPIHTTIRNPTPKPPTQGQSLTSPQIPIRNPSAQPQPQVPAEISPNTNCICTPFFKCYDEETSSNLTTLVDDRSFIPSKQQGSCSDPNDVCCINLVKPSETLTTISLPDSHPPNPSQILHQSTSNSRLTQAPVSSTGSGNNPFGVIWPDK